jgi:hypothetical protein
VGLERDARSEGKEEAALQRIEVGGRARVWWDTAMGDGAAGPPTSSDWEADPTAITVDWSYRTEPLTRSEFDGLADAIREVEPGVPVRPSSAWDLDGDPAELDPSPRAPMGVLAELIQIALPAAAFAGTRASETLIDRIADKAVDWLERRRQRRLGSGGTVQVDLLGPDGTVLKRVEVPSEHVGRGARDA